MPGGGVRSSEIPFSYTKLCYEIASLVLIAAAFILGDWHPSSIFVGVMVVGFIASATLLLFLKVVWRLLPDSVRARIPYDSKEAGELKGDIRSFWDLRKLLL
jgi:hypothetical protein